MVTFPLKPSYFTVAIWLLFRSQLDLTTGHGGCHGDALSPRLCSSEVSCRSRLSLISRSLYSSIFSSLFSAWICLSCARAFSTATFRRPWGRKRHASAYADKNTVLRLDQTSAGGLCFPLRRESSSRFHLIFILLFCPLSLLHFLSFCTFSLLPSLSFALSLFCSLFCTCSL